MLKELLSMEKVQTDPFIVIGNLEIIYYSDCDKYSLFDLYLIIINKEYLCKYYLIYTNK